MVNKEKSIKPVLNFTPTKLDRLFGEVERYTCRTCGNSLLEKRAKFRRNINNYCYNCGQKLDWSDSLE